jgi:hypothetical protein
MSITARSARRDVVESSERTRHSTAAAVDLRGRGAASVVSRGLIDAKLKLRVSVVTTFTNTITTPVLPLPPGNFILHAAEDLELVEQEPGRWLITRVDVQPLSNIPIPEGSFPTPFPLLPSVPRNP